MLFLLILACCSSGLYFISRWSTETEIFQEYSESLYNASLNFFALFTVFLYSDLNQHILSIGSFFLYIPSAVCLYASGKSIYIKQKDLSAGVKVEWELKIVRDICIALSVAVVGIGLENFSELTVLNWVLGASFVGMYPFILYMSKRPKLSFKKVFK